MEDWDDGYPDDYEEQEQIDDILLQEGIETEDLNNVSEDEMEEAMYDAEYDMEDFDDNMEDLNDPDDF